MHVVLSILFFLTSTLRIAVVAFSNQRFNLASLPSSKTGITSSTKSFATKYEFALLFDCDGVILETEELHRKAYNSAFGNAGVKIVSSRMASANSNVAISEDPVVWTVEYYDILQNSIGGGKPKMRHYFREVLNESYADDIDVVDLKIVATLNDQQETMEIYPDDLNTDKGIEKLEGLIDELQTTKTKLYKETVEENAETRPGVLELMDQAIESKSIALGVCSAATKESALKVLDVCLGTNRVQSLDVCILGDDVSEKKPSPMIYNEARKRLGIDDSRKCVVIEDSAVGLRAAKSANMRTLITYTPSTENEDFYELGADAKVPCLCSDRGRITLGDIFDPMKDGKWKNEPELLVDIRDGIDSFESIPEPVTFNTDLADEVLTLNKPPTTEQQQSKTIQPSPNKSSQLNTSRRLKLFQDDMGNFST